MVVIPALGTGVSKVPLQGVRVRPSARLVSGGPECVAGERIEKRALGGMAERESGNTLK